MAEPSLSIDGPLLEASEVELFCRPTPIYVLGDSHTLTFTDLVFRDKRSGEFFLTRSRFVSTAIAANDFTDAQGNIHQGIINHMFSDFLLKLIDNRLEPVHLSTHYGSRQGAFAIERPRSVPILLFFIGDPDLRGGVLKELGTNTDFDLPFHVPYLDELPKHEATQHIPFDLIRNRVLQMLTPAFVGFDNLIKSGFSRIFLHSIPPPAVDDELFVGVNKYFAPVLLRYKLAALFNHLMADLCRQHNVTFINIWDQVTLRNRLNPKYSLDGVHLNKHAALITIREVVKAVTTMPGAALKPAYEMLRSDAQAEFSKREEAASGGGEIADFDQHGLVRLQMPEDVIASLRTELDFSGPSSPPVHNMDWAASPNFRLVDGCKLVQPSPKALEATYLLAYSPAFANTVTGCLRSEFTVLSAKHAQAQAAPGPREAEFLAEDCPPGVLRALVYLDDVPAESAFQYLGPDGAPVSAGGPAGTAVIYDPGRIRHRQMPAGQARIVHLVLAPRAPAEAWLYAAGSSKPRLIWAGLNDWPVDPVRFSVEGCMVQGEG